MTATLQQRKSANVWEQFCEAGEAGEAGEELTARFSPNPQSPVPNPQSLAILY
ncbi:hypothetical protein [Anabaena sp. YBS01]|uniref:hypothetical protein n=1 Tax=Anabaena sp. YBS01 TaxID=2490939 RepID=UPI0012939431|nr:hypothetical protein [Anabaena sp. YBS01]